MSEPRGILGMQMFALVAAARITFSDCLIIKGHTFYSQPKRRLLFLFLAFFILSVLGVQYWWRLFNLFFYCRWWVIQLICICMDFDPFQFFHIKHHNIILLLGDLSNPPKQKYHFGLFVADHRVAFSFIRPWFSRPGFRNLLPRLGLKVVAPHIVKNNVGVGAAEHIKLVINNTATEIPSRFWDQLALYLNLLHYHLITPQILQANLKQTVAVDSSLRLVPTKYVHVTVFN